VADFALGLGLDGMVLVLWVGRRAFRAGGPVPLYFARTSSPL
jgi:hypothetical protein